MFIVFLGGVALDDPPLTSVQMLWVNLIMDTCAALALATEPPTDSLLERKPYSRNDLIVTPIMWRNIVGQALFQATTLIVFLFAGKQIFGLEYEDDSPFYIKTEAGILTIVVQCLMVQYGGQSMRTVPLTYEQHGMCIGIGAFSLIWGLVVKSALPVSLFSRIQMQEEPMSDEQERYAVTSTFRKSFRQSSRKSTHNKTMDASMNAN